MPEVGDIAPDFTIPSAIGKLGGCPIPLARGPDLEVSRVYEVVDGDVRIGIHATYVLSEAGRSFTRIRSSSLTAWASS